MKKSISSFLIPFVAMAFSLIAVSAQAQEDGITSFDLQNSSSQNSNSQFTERDNRTTKTTISVRDSLQISDFYQKPKGADRKSSNAVSSGSSNEEVDALSLNFLFYIIENYKFSDLMDTK